MTAAFQPEQIRQTTQQLEQGNAGGLQQLLSGRSEQERVQALDLIKAQYKQDSAGNSQLPKLEFEHSAWIPGYDFESVRSNGKEIFHSRLDISSLTRQDFINGQPLGLSQRVVGDQPKIDVRKLTDLLEKGDGDGANALMAPLAEEERIQALQLAAKMNRDDLEHGGRVSLDIAIKTTKLRQNVISVERVLDAHDYWFGGAPLYSETFSPDTGEVKISHHVDDRKQS